MRCRERHEGEEAEKNYSCIHLSMGLTKDELQETTLLFSSNLC